MHSVPGIRIAVDRFARAARRSLCFLSQSLTMSAGTRLLSHVVFEPSGRLQLPQRTCQWLHICKAKQLLRVQKAYLIPIQMPSNTVKLRSASDLLYVTIVSDFFPDDLQRPFAVRVCAFCVAERFFGARRGSPHVHGIFDIGFFVSWLDLRSWPVKGSALY